MCSHIGTHHSLSTSIELHSSTVYGLWMLSWGLKVAMANRDRWRENLGNLYHQCNRLMIYIYIYIYIYYQLIFFFFKTACSILAKFSSSFFSMQFVKIQVVQLHTHTHTHTHTYIYTYIYIYIYNADKILRNR